MSESALTEPAAEPAVDVPGDPAPARLIEDGASAGETSLVVEKSEHGDGSSGPSYVFFGSLAAITLLADVLTKAWAEIHLTTRPPHDPSIVLVTNHLTFTLAYNRGGAWGLLQSASEYVRRPFFLCVSVAAVIFIVSLYSRLAPMQRALKWGLPLVLGGALGNLTDRIVRTSVVDFIDYRGDWITKMNEGIAAVFPAWNVTDHWPTFNVADMCICAGVALMAIDMIGSKHSPKPAMPPAASVG
jgi:lipoprotein signal peptidase